MRKGDALCLLTVDLAAHGLKPVTEHRFCERRWRFDLAWPEKMLAVEVDGGTWTGGRHTTGKGYEGDSRKVNRAVLLGWRVLRYTSNMVRDGEAIGEIVEVLR